jgi:hypothetical protein
MNDADGKVADYHCRKSVEVRAYLNGIFTLGFNTL